MTTPPNNTAVLKAQAAVAAKPQVRSITDLIKESIKELQTALPAHMNAERIARIALTTIRLNPKLTECTPASFLGALFQSAQLGLEPNINGEAWIIPYKNTKKVGDTFIKVMEAQFQVGAYGWVKLFYNHQNSVTLQMETVHANDDFSYDLGTSQVHHSPPPFGQERGEVRGYYAIATLANGGRVAKVMSKKDAYEHAKKHSKCFDKETNDFMKGTPWKDHFDAMAQVTVLKQVMKLVPKSVEIQRALAMDQTTKTRLDADMLNVADETNWADAEVVDEKKGELTEGKKDDLKKATLPKAEPAKTGEVTKAQAPAEVKKQDPVVATSEENKKRFEAAIRTLKSASSIEKMGEEITKESGAGNLTEAHKRDLFELLEGRQQVIISIVEKEKGRPGKPEEQKTGFDPNVEIMDFGKHKGKKWIEVPTSWLRWLKENSQKPDVKEKVNATLIAKGEPIDAPNQE